MFWQYLLFLSRNCYYYHFLLLTEWRIFRYRNHRLITIGKNRSIPKQYHRTNSPTEWRAAATALRHRTPSSRPLHPGQTESHQLLSAFQAWIHKPRNIWTGPPHAEHTAGENRQEETPAITAHTGPSRVRHGAHLRNHSRVRGFRTGTDLLLPVWVGRQQHYRAVAEGTGERMESAGQRECWEGVEE